MRTKSYNALMKIAENEYNFTSAGISIVRQHDKYFSKNRNKQGQNWLYMNYREKCCHVIGFIDAIIWLGRNDALDVSPRHIHVPPDTEFDSEDELINQHIGEYTKRLILSLLSSFETGHDIDYNEGG